MKILIPKRVTDSILTSSTVPEDDYPVFNPATTYSEGQRVIRTQTHKIYESIVNSNTGNTPETNPTKWLDLGSTNRWKMFDQRISAQTTATETFTVQLEPGPIQSLAFINMDANEVHVKLTDPDYGVLFEQTFDLRSKDAPSTWWYFWFQPWVYRDSLFIDGIPTSPDGTLEITLTGGETDEVKLGALVLGNLKTYAENVHTGATVEIEDYSRREVDQWGNIDLVQGNWAKTARWEVLVPKSQLDEMQRTIASIRATPAVIVGSKAFDATIIYGIVRDFAQIIDYPEHFMCRMEALSLV